MNGGRPEILAPAGDPTSLRAAIAAGADAVYLGMARFNARGRAERFRGVALESCVRTAHRHGVRVYVTLNTLVHEDELPKAVDLAVEARAAGADAAIVQDLGLAAALREVVPDLKLHASTQMTVHQADQAAVLVEALGIRRVILARECSLEEVRRIGARLRPLGAGVEVFVHGALCFAYSGQCLMSNFAGRRSANRGICAQNCRFDFSRGPVVASKDIRRVGPPGPEAVGPGEMRRTPPEAAWIPRFDRRSATQLISLKDLAAFGSVSALADCGVEAFKIEGRLKGPTYVSEVVRLYRAALDAWQEGRGFASRDAERIAGRVFSRGFTNGYLSARVDPSMRGDKRSLQGEPDAVVVSANRKAGLVTLAPREGHEIRAGQGYRYAHDRYRGGFRVVGVRAGAARTVMARVRFGAEARGRSHRRGAAGRRRPPPPLPEGLACYLNHDPELERRAEALVGTVSVQCVPPSVGLRVFVEGASGRPLRARVETEDGRAAEAESGAPLEVPRIRALDEAILAEHLGRLGGTGYHLSGLDVSRLVGPVFMGFPAIHALRRDLVARLEAPSRIAAPRPIPSSADRGPDRPTQLVVVVGTPAAWVEARASGAGRLVIEDVAVHGGAPAWEAPWRGVLGKQGAEPCSIPPTSPAAGAGASPPEASHRAWFRLPPISHADGADREMLRRIQRAFPEAGIIAGHLGQIGLAAGAGLRIAADSYLNAYSSGSIALLRSLGVTRVALSHEVDAREAARVAAVAGAEVEVVVGGAVPSMLTRQDFGLSGGEELLATSEHGHRYRFVASPAGFTTLYEARELVGASVVPLLAGRVDAVRLDLAHQPPEAVREIVAAYRAILDAASCGPGSEVGRGGAGTATEAAVGRAGEAHRRWSPVGTFPGHLVRGARTLDSDATASEACSG